MSDQTREFQFEKEICAEMAKRGWAHSRDDSGYDRASALYFPDLMDWLKVACPKQLHAVEDVFGPDTPQEIAKRISKAAEENPKGILGILDELKIVANGSQVLQLYQRRPVSGMNPDTKRLFEAQKYRVMQQVHYSVHNEKCIDLVLFVNGLPFVTLELKSSFKQTVGDAIQQYKKDRDPGKPKTNSNEPLLAFGQRSLVHFAVDGEEVYMTTRLAGEATKFLPFNKGHNMGKGNPPNPNGYPVSYLWEEVLTPSGISELLDNFIKRIKIKVADKSGQLRDDDRIVFPRYHQWDAARKLLSVARKEGIGNRYLIQHSAGSGKSNTIGWLAHGLSALRGDDDKAVFDGVIIVTDRRVLDDQLGSTVEGFATQTGEVLRVAEEDQARSKTLAEALEGKKRIIIVTLQTFPFVISKLSEAALAGRKFAVIADEAHSSQSGSASSKLKQALGLAEAERKASGAAGDSAEGEGEGEGEEEESLDDILAAASTSRGAPKNVSFFAFTATPKAKTLQIFGRLPNPNRPASDNNKPESFHVYTMKQAIEEGFILDVLKNYTCYDVLCKVTADGKTVEEREVDKHKGSAKIRRWIDLHPTNIAQKCKIILGHFQENVKPMFNGEAKAMVVTSGRLDAVRFKQAMDKLIRESGIKGVGVVVAFSGEVVDPDVPGMKYTETSMNPELKGMDIPLAIKKPEFNLLIVANKFQTGYDEPLLCGMYVDKLLSGVATVQTFSRLNRIFPGKERTYILDFKNKPETVQKDFNPYYKVSELSGVSDPNLLFELQSKLDARQIYTAEEVAACAKAFIEGAKNAQAEIIKAVKPGADRFRTRMSDAQEAKDGEAINDLQIFRKQCIAFLNAYEFLAQVYIYKDSSLEKFYIYIKALVGMIRDDSFIVDADISGLKLDGVVSIPSAPVSIELDGDKKLKPLIDVGSQTMSARERARIEEILKRINELFDGNITEDQKKLFTFGIVNSLANDKEVLSQAKANDQATFAEGDFKEKVRTAIATQVEGHKDMGRQILAKEKLELYVKLLAELAHGRLQERASEFGVEEGK